MSSLEKGKPSVYLDKTLVVSLLEELLSFIESEEKNIGLVQHLNTKLNSIFQESGLDKQLLITRWIQISGQEAFDRLKVDTLDKYLKVLPLILKTSAIYLNKTNDYLYLLAELSIATDWVLYQIIDLGAN